MKIKPGYTIYNTIWNDISLRAIFSDNSSVVKLFGAPAILVPVETKSVLADDAGLISCNRILDCHTSGIGFTHWNTNNLNKYVLEAATKQ